MRLPSPQLVIVPHLARLDLTKTLLPLIFFLLLASSPAFHAAFSSLPCNSSHSSPRDHRSSSLRQPFLFHSRHQSLLQLPTNLSPATTNTFLFFLPVRDLSLSPSISISIHRRRRITPTSFFSPAASHIPLCITFCDFLLWRCYRDLQLRRPPKPPLFFFSRPPSSATVGESSRSPLSQNPVTSITVHPTTLPHSTRSLPFISVLRSPPCSLPTSTVPTHSNSFSFSLLRRPPIRASTPSISNIKNLKFCPHRKV